MASQINCNILVSDGSGFRFPQMTTTVRNSLANKTTGTTIWNTTTSKMEQWDGSKWVEIT